ncbi:MAG: threonylcarbamoyl-AMP synthase [Clostridia bacterium]|nr:threonylcarbamoyl-AMP synthase [Clostridia bacterium]
MNTKILKIDDYSLKYSKNLIEAKELVAFPTETVYGLGALATSDEAVKKIYEAKGRPSDNPLIVHVHKNYDISSLVFIEHGYVKKLQEAFLPGPLTMVYKSKGVVCNTVSCGLDTLAIRVPSSKEAQMFLEYVDAPIAAPSANVSKHTSPVTSEHVFNDLNGKINLILDGGKCEGGIESTVLDVTTETPIILRSGLITCQMIKEVVGKCEYASGVSEIVNRSPGTKYSHYMPKCQTALFTLDSLQDAQNYYDECVKQGKRTYFLCYDGVLKYLNGNVLNLGKTATEIASNLYFNLLEAEKICDVLIAIEVKTGSEIDVSIMNRLSKACKSAIK